LAILGHRLADAGLAIAGSARILADMNPEDMATIAAEVAA